MLVEHMHLCFANRYSAQFFCIRNLEQARARQEAERDYLQPDEC